MATIDTFVRWLLLTHEGRRALAITYLTLGAITVVIYWFERDPVFAIGQAVVILAGYFWTRFCLRRA